MLESPILKFYDGQNIFITGGSGFLGKVLIEKLLRSTNVSKIYVLLRPKQGKSIETRLDEIINSILFQKLKTENPCFRNRIIPINGDCSDNNLGLTLNDRQELIENVNVVFHIAAVNDSLKLSFNINANCTRDVLVMCKQMQHLKSIVYVSTVYTHCYRDTIDEICHGSPKQYEEVASILQDLTSEEIDELTPRLLGKWPNTYTFTKLLAESWIKNNAKNLTIGILRPSLMVSTYKEPFEGWMDNFYGTTGIYCGIYDGSIRVMHCNYDGLIDLVPVDGCAAIAIAIAWDIYRKPKNDKIPIYNYVSSPENPVTWGEYINSNITNSQKYPTNSLIWTPCDVIIIKFFVIFYIVAMVMDGLKQQKNTRFLQMNQWKFRNENVVSLWEKMSENDQKLFPFSMRLVNWHRFFENYLKGIRIYVLKEPLTNLNEAQNKLKRFVMIRKIMVFAISILLYLLLFLFFL